MATESRFARQGAEDHQPVLCHFILNSRCGLNPHRVELKLPTGTDVQGNLEAITEHAFKSCDQVFSLTENPTSKPHWHYLCGQVDIDKGKHELHANCFTPIDVSQKSLADSEGEPGSLTRLCDTIRLVDGQSPEFELSTSPLQTLALTEIPGPGETPRRSLRQKSSADLFCELSYIAQNPVEFSDIRARGLRVSQAVSDMQGKEMTIEALGQLDDDLERNRQSSQNGRPVPPPPRRGHYHASDPQVQILSKSKWICDEVTSLLVVDKLKETLMDSVNRLSDSKRLSDVRLRLQEIKQNSSILQGAVASRGEQWLREHDVVLKTLLAAQKWYKDQEIVNPTSVHIERATSLVSEFGLHRALVLLNWSCDTVSNQVSTFLNTWEEMSLPRDGQASLDFDSLPSATMPSLSISACKADSPAYLAHGTTS